LFADTAFLLAMLRRAKFSQLEARRLIENILTAKTLFPDYMSNIDLTDPGILAFIDKGSVRSRERSVLELHH